MTTLKIFDVVHRGTGEASRLVDKNGIPSAYILSKKVSEIFKQLRKDYLCEKAIIQTGRIPRNDLLAVRIKVCGENVRFRSYTPNKDGRYFVTVAFN